MNFKDIFKGIPKAEATKTVAPKSDIILKLQQEFQDRSRKDIQKWRQAIKLAENPDDPRWYLMQDLIDDLLIDAHVSSVIGIRKSATLNHRFYVIDKKSKEQLDEQTELLNKKWFYDFMDESLNAIVRKYSVLQLFRYGDTIKLDIIPRRNICPQSTRIYTEVGGSNSIDYSTYPNVIEILHNSKFGIFNDISANVIWKRNVLQSNAEFSERFGMPLITATTSNKADVPRIDQALKNLGESATGVLPNGTEIIVHDLANQGNPEKVYLEPAKFHDNQISKRFLGSTTITDEGANRNQTQVHIETLDDKLATDDKRMVTFTVNDKLFPLLQLFGFPFNAETMAFQFDETEDLTLSEQWSITNEALNHFDLEEDEVRKTFNLPIKGIKAKTFNPAGGFSANFR
jgi:phage gp29-like protein